MLLEVLELSNYRQFETLRVDFDKQITVLAGPNGSGKTAILDAAAIALSTFFYALDVPTKTILRSDARIITREIGERAEVREAYPVKVGARGNALGRSLSWTRTLNSASGSTTRIYAKQMIGLSQEIRAQLDGVLSNERSDELVLPVISYYGTGRLWSQKRAPQDGRFDPYKRESGYQNCLDASSDEKRFMSWMSAMDYAEYKERRSVKQYKLVCEMLAGLFSSISGEKNVLVAYDRRKQDLTVSHRLGGKEIELPMRSLSDGYRTVLGMVGDIAYRMCELNPQLGESALVVTPGVVLIDEIDLHLHPKWQVRVIKDLTELFPQVQFIVTTHAPSVISSVEREHVRMLNGTPEVTVPATQTYGRDVSSIFREIMQAPERQKKVSDLFGELDKAFDNDDVKSARGLLAKLESLIGNTDPDLVGARTTLSLME